MCDGIDFDDIMCDTIGREVDCGIVGCDAVDCNISSDVSAGGDIVCDDDDDGTVDITLDVACDVIGCFLGLYSGGGTYLGGGCDWHLLLTILICKFQQKKIIKWNFAKGNVSGKVHQTVLQHVAYMQL